MEFKQARGLAVVKKYCQLIQIAKTYKAVDKIRCVCVFDSSLGPWVPTPPAAFVGCALLCRTVFLSHPWSAAQTLSLHGSCFALQSCACWQVAYLPYLCLPRVCRPWPVPSGARVPLMCVEMPLELKTQACHC